MAVLASPHLAIALAAAFALTGAAHAAKKATKPHAGKTVRKRPPTKAPVAKKRPPATIAHAPVAPPPAGADQDCLRELGGRGISFTTVGALEGVRTPVEILGPIDGIRLVSRGRRPALMDCELARSLADAAPIFHQAQVTGLSFSAGYDYRTMRGSTELSNHAHGLAIDVHAFEAHGGVLDVERDFAKGAGQWEGFGPGRGRGAVEACVGAPATPAGRTLRTIACSLNRHPAFNVILTPDDNYDHRNHFHIESYANRSSLVGHSDRGTHGPADDRQARRPLRR